MEYTNNTVNTFPNGNYNGYNNNNFNGYNNGYNNNNFDRKNFPSNVYPMNINGGNSGNPFENFNSLTTNQQKLMNSSMNHTKFSDAYRTSNALIEPVNYSNQNKLLHNNISDNVLDEHVVEYQISIDSIDRDISAYPNPFDFKVKFNPPSGSNLRTTSLKNGVMVNTTEYISGPPKPHINRDFKNVKYIKLENIILPQYSNITEVGGEYIFDQDNYLVDDRYVSLVIPELSCNNVYCTSDGNERYDITSGFVTPPRQFAHIFPDKLLGNVYYTGTPYNGSKIYKNSSLGNINSLSIQLYNSNGSLLRFNNLYSASEIKASEDTNDPILRTNIRHPLYKGLQVHLSFMIGVVESQINTNTKFEMS